MNDLAGVDGGPLNGKPSLFAYVEHGHIRVPDTEDIVAHHQPADHLSELLPSTEPKFKTNDHTNGKPKGSADCLRWTYRQFSHAGIKLTAGLLDAGVKPGSMVVSFIPNSTEYLLLLWPSTLGKFGLTCLDPGATSEPRRDELQHYIDALRPAAIIVADSACANAIDLAMKLDRSYAYAPLLIIIVCTPKIPSGWISLLSVCGSASARDTSKLQENARTDSRNRIS
jgi:hypothetical protein